jgi:hypothetical protein
MPTTIPRYALAPIADCRDYWIDALRLLRISSQGIEELISLPDLMESLGYSGKPSFGRKRTPEQIEKERATWQEAKETSLFARKEVESQFPLLHAHTLVGMWGALETAIDDLIVALLINEKDVLNNDAVKKVRIPLADFQLLDEDGRARFIVTELGRTLSAGTRRGIETFESLLNCVGLSGSVDAETKKAIWEAQNVRNVIVHRRSIADRNIVENCPWRGLKPGDQLVVSSEDLSRYGTAFRQYLILLEGRLKNRYSRPK